jgi:hypothetical protein
MRPRKAVVSNQHRSPATEVSSGSCATMISTQNSLCPSHNLEIVKTRMKTRMTWTTSAFLMALPHMSLMPTTLPWTLTTILASTCTSTAKVNLAQTPPSNPYTTKGMPCRTCTPFHIAQHSLPPRRLSLRPYRSFTLTHMPPTSAVLPFRRPHFLLLLGQTLS